MRVTRAETIIFELYSLFDENKVSTLKKRSLLILRGRIEESCRFPRNVTQSREKKKKERRERKKVVGFGGLGKDGRRV